MGKVWLGLIGIVVALICQPVCAEKHTAFPSANSACILNSGSTNTQGYTIFVAPSGETLSYTGTVLHSLGTLCATNMMHKGNITKALAAKFFSDIKAAQPFAQLPVNHTFKSVSFGTSTFVEYKGQQTQDLSSPADSRGQALVADVKNITLVLGLKNMPRRPVGPMTPPVPGH